MTTKIFEWREDEEYGGEGWVLEGAPKEFNAGGGQLVAHDCLEHFWDGKTDRWEDELLALGALTFIRWEPGFFSGRYQASLSDNLSGDLYNCLHFILSERELRPMKVRRLDDELIDGELYEAVRKARREIGGDIPEINDAEIEKIVSWMRVGYRRAKRRFKHGGRALMLFDQIQREVDKRGKFADFGSKLKVSFCIKRFTAKVELIESDYEY